MLVGAASGSLTAAAVRDWYPSLIAPPGKPPNALFAPVWSALYIAMGIAAWRVWRPAAALGQRAALQLWGWQLLVNAAWTPAFFGLHSPGLGMVVIVPMLLLIGLTMRAFARIDRLAAIFLLPYLLWTGYATYLNAGFWWLNRL